jgi:ribosome biogenesis protein NSA2
MPQNEHIELFRKRHGRRLDHDERQRKREARAVHKNAKSAKTLRGIKAKLNNKERFTEKVRMRKL